MKKILSMLLSAVLCLCLAGCNMTGYPKETDMEYMVSALGFDTTAEGVAALAEIVIVNSDSKSDAGTKKVFSGKGETAETALYSLRSALSKPLLLNHCGLLVLGQGLSAGQLTEIWDYCLRDKNITQAIEVVCTENAEKLLTVKPLSASAMGYEISTAIKQNSEYTGIKYRNRFYQIETGRYKRVNCYSVPYIAVAGENAVVGGLQIYCNDTAFSHISEEKAPLYALLCGNYESGQIKLENTCVHTDLADVGYEFSYDGQELKIDMTVELKNSEEGAKALEQKLQQTAHTDRDIFGIADRIYRENTGLWEEISNSYEELFAKAGISVTLRSR